MITWVMHQYQTLTGASSWHVDLSLQLTEIKGVALPKTGQLTMAVHCMLILRTGYGENKIIWSSCKYII